MRRQILLFLLAVCASRAAVVRVDNSAVTHETGYDRIAARVDFAIDPALAVNRAIVDLDRAPRNAAGQVEFSADLVLLKPQKPNGTLLLDIPNRGNRTATGAFNEGFLMEAGFTVAWVGWQFDVPEGSNLVRLHPPVARGIK